MYGGFGKTGIRCESAQAGMPLERSSKVLIPLSRDQSEIEGVLKLGKKLCVTGRVNRSCRASLRNGIIASILLAVLC